MRIRNFAALAVIATFVAGNAQAQTLGVDPDKVPDEQVQAFDTPPEREPKGAIEEMVITAQRKSESLQEVPIAVSAFNAEALELQQITGFTDLQFSAPNVSFTKTNFAGSNFSIRGIGSAAVAASGSPGVAFHINEAALPTLIFETEYFDLERVEILRGPQGTLYGQSATGGVVNVITAKPNFDEFGADIELEYGNYETFKVRGAVNIPITDWLAVRIAGLSLQRDGMIENLYKGSEVGRDDVDGRDLYSIRATVAADITDTTSASFMWSRFYENDNRARVTNQRCNPTDTSQLGCDWRGSVETMLAEDPYGQSVVGNLFASYSGLLPFGELPADMNPKSPEVQNELNNDFRKVYTDMDPTYQAENNLYLLEVTQELPAELTAVFLGGYSEISTSSAQDYNMNVGPRFIPTTQNCTADTPGCQEGSGYPQGTLPVSGPKPFNYSDENLLGVFNNEIYRFSDRVFSYDQSFGTNDTWYGEGRISSDWDGMFNFLAGFNYGNTTTKGAYRVLSNTLEAVAVSAAAIQAPVGAVPAIPGFNGLYPSFFSNVTNPTVRNGMGVYGEGYVNILPNLKLTGGVRWNYDHKTVRDRSTLFNSLQVGGEVGVPPERACLIDTDPLTPGNQPDYTCIAGAGYAPIGPAQPGVVPPNATNKDTCDPASPDYVEGTLCVLPGGPLPVYNMARELKGSNTEATWDAWTGRFVLDYAAELPFTDETLTYFSYSRGYRPGGFNPAVNPQQPGFEGISDEFLPEFVNAYEIGAKNTWHDIGLRANLTAFIYDYKDYQVSKIANRTALNENVDALIWGVELESMWALPWVPGALLDFNFSYLGSEVTEDFGSIDPRDPIGEQYYEDRGERNPYFLGKDSIFGQPCAVNKDQFIDAIRDGTLADAGGYVPYQGGNQYDPETTTWTTAMHSDGEEVLVPTLLNCGAMRAVPGMADDADHPSGYEHKYDLQGNELPNAPTYSVKVGAQYTLPIEALAIDITPRTDFYWQSAMWGRVYNAPLDKIPSWYRWDAQLIVEDAEARWFVRGFIKNILNDSNVTGLYVSDAATANFTNVFTIEPRLFGVAVGAHF